MPAEPRGRPTEPPEPVAGILLAAGTASRMGSNKLLLKVEGESLLRRAARHALAAGVAPLLVVLGHQAELAARELQGLDCRVVLNAAYERGMVSSLQTGVAALPAEVPAAVVMLADMPFVTAEMVAALIARYRTAGPLLVVSDYEGVNAPPMLYDRTLFEEIRTMTGGACGKQIVKRHRDRAEALAWPAAALADVDIPDDYARLQTAGEGG